MIDAMQLLTSAINNFDVSLNEAINCLLGGFSGITSASILWYGIIKGL